QRAVLGDGVLGLGVLGIAVTLSGLLTGSGALQAVSLGLAAGVVAVVAAALALATWLVAPSRRWDEAAPAGRSAELAKPFSTTARDPFGRRVVSVYGSYAFTLGTIDAVWRSYFAAAGAPALLTG